jgi:hypothetical protein
VDRLLPKMAVRDMFLACLDVQQEYLPGAKGAVTSEPGGIAPGIESHMNKR